MCHEANRLAWTSRRWAVIGPTAAASVLPAAHLTLVFARLESAVPTFLTFLAAIVVGPLNYWLPLLTGHSIQYGIHPMAGVTIWVYLTCLLLVFSHPVKPHLVTAVMGIIGSVVW